MPLADRAVLGQRAPGLPHEPHRRPLDGFAPRGADEQRFHAAYTSRPWRQGRLPSAGATGRSTTRTRARSAARASSSRTPARVAWRDGIRLAYHWLDERGNPIVWDGERTPLPAARARRARDGRARACARRSRPGRYRFALDLVAEHRAWFSELGSEIAAADVEVLPRDGRRARAELPDWVEPAPDWDERVAAAHAEGYAVVAGAIEWLGGLAAAGGRARSRRTSRARAGSRASRIRCSARPCSTGSSSSGSPTSQGCPAFAAPADEPWLYDGRIVLRAQPRRRASARADGASGGQAYRVGDRAHDALTNSKGSFHGRLGRIARCRPTCAT